MVKYLKQQSEVAYADLQEAIKDLDERGSWGRLTAREGDYLHSDGSILGQVTHVAGCKVLYASAAFKGFEHRLQEVTARTIAIGTNWDHAKQYLDESHAYWLDSWNEVADDSLDDLVATNWGDEWAVWRIIHTVTGHDHYHAGQITLIRSVAATAVEPPSPISDEEIEFLKTFAAW